jgi:RNA recognition motif-containing protein
LNNWIFLSYLDRRPFYGVAVFFFPAEPEKAVKNMDTRIYVGNLSKSTTQDEINTLFAQAGTVSTVELVKDRDSGLSKGFAFVTMPTQAEADKAISMYNAYSMAGNEIKVNIAKPRSENAPRS